MSSSSKRMNSITNCVKGGTAYKLQKLNLTEAEINDSYYMASLFHWCAFNKRHGVAILTELLRHDPQGIQRPALFVPSGNDNDTYSKSHITPLLWAIILENWRLADFLMLKYASVSFPQDSVKLYDEIYANMASIQDVDAHSTFKTFIQYLTRSWSLSVVSEKIISALKGTNPNRFLLLAALIPTLSYKKDFKKDMTLEAFHLPDETLLTLAIKSNDLAVVKIIVENDIALINSKAKDSQGNTINPLIVALTFCRNADIAIYLLDFHKDITLVIPPRGSMELTTQYNNNVKICNQYLQTKGATNRLPYANTTPTSSLQTPSKRKQKNPATQSYSTIIDLTDNGNTSTLTAQDLQSEKTGAKRSREQRDTSSQSASSSHSSSEIVFTGNTQNLLRTAKAYYDKKEYNTAYEYYYKVAKAKDTPNELYYKVRYYMGACAKNFQSYAIAFEHFQFLAANNIPVALYELSQFYYNGIHVTKDLKTAAFYLRRATKEEYSPAYFALAFLYYQGIDGKKDQEKAEKYAKLAIPHETENKEASQLLQLIQTEMKESNERQNASIYLQAPMSNNTLSGNNSDDELEQEIFDFMRRNVEKPEKRPVKRRDTRTVSSEPIFSEDDVIIQSPDDTTSAFTPFWGGLPNTNTPEYVLEEEQEKKREAELSSGSFLTCSYGSKSQ